MRPTGADAFRLAVEGGRVVLEFGRAAGPSAADPGGVVALSDRVTLAPQVADRLLVGLRDALARQAAAAAPAAAAADPLAAPEGLGAAPANLPPDPAAVVAERLLEHIRALGVPYQHERSFRLAPGGLQANRFLVSLNKADLGAQAAQRALAVARALGLPEDAARAVAARFDEAQSLHFGFEAGGAAPLCKLYLERRVRADEAARAAERGEGVMLHLAWKWAADTGAHVVTRYDWYPGLDAAGIERRLRALYAAAGAADGEELRVALETLALAASRTTSLQYLEVHEDANARRSFDLNLYDAGLQVRDLVPQLLRLRDLYAIRPGQLQAVLDQVKARALGHLAGGVHRDGRGFFNVYYGVTAHPQFAARL